jgi:hypothetical protein
MSVGYIAKGILASQNHESIRKLAERNCQFVRSKDYVSEILANHNLVWGHTRYMRDPRTVELIKAPYIVAGQVARGEIPSIDCDDMAGFEGALHLATGCEVRLVTAAFRHMFYNGERQYSHVYVEAREPRSGTWIVCDPVAGVDTGKMLRRIVAKKYWPIA